MDAFKVAKAMTTFTADNKTRKLQQQHFRAYVHELTTRMPELAISSVSLDGPVLTQGGSTTWKYAGQQLARRALEARLRPTRTALRRDRRRRCIHGLRLRADAAMSVTIRETKPPPSNRPLLFFHDPRGGDMRSVGQHGDIVATIAAALNEVSGALLLAAGATRVLVPGPARRTGEWYDLRAEPPRNPADIAR